MFQPRHPARQIPTPSPKGDQRETSATKITRVRNAAQISHPSPPSHARPTLAQSWNHNVTK